MHGTIHLAGQAYRVSIQHGRRFIGDEEVHAFVERMSLLGRKDVLHDLAVIGRDSLHGRLTLNSPQQTAFALHQARTRAN